MQLRLNLPGIAGLVRRVLTLGVGMLLVSGCDYCAAAAILCADVRTECDPTTFENRCPDPQTILNCMPEQKAGCPRRWYEHAWPCDAPNQCQPLDGVAACVATPVETCDLGSGGSYPNRCVEGSHQLCVPVGFDDEVEPDHGYWQHTNRACEP